MKIPLFLPAIIRAPYYRKVRSIIGANPIAYWPLWEASGSVARDLSSNNRHAAYVSPLTLADAISPAGKPAPLFSSTGKVNVYSAGLEAAFPFKEGACSIWFKVSGAGVWTDGIIRQVIILYTDNNNRLMIRRSATDNRIDTFYIANSISKNIGISFLASTDWQNVTLSWSFSGDAFTIYHNGELVSTLTGLGEWQGVTLNATNQVIGAFNLADIVGNWSGWLADAFIIGRPITAGEALKIYESAPGYNLKTLTVLGDSISNDTGDWPYYLIRTYNRAAVVLYDHAVAGDTIAAGLDAQVVAAASDNADTIIIHMGTNDNNAGDMEALQAEIEENLLELKASNPNATIYYMNVLPRWTDSGGGTPVDKSNIRAAIAAACTAQEVTCWDTFTDPWIAAAQTLDGVHPTADGHQAITTRILALLS